MIFLRDVLSGETNKDLEGDRLTVAKAACPPQTPPLGHAGLQGELFSFVGGWIIKLYAVEIKTYRLILYSTLLNYAG